MITKSSTAFGYFMLLAKMPSFLSAIFGVSIENNGTLSAVATGSTSISASVAPVLARLMINRCPSIRKIAIRKIFQTISMIGPALTLVLITMLECNLWAAITLMCVALLFFGFLTGGEFTVISDFAPNFAGSVMGFCHLLPNAMGIVGPYVVGLILDSELMGSVNQKWNIIFYITAGYFIAGSIVFIIFATDTQQSWDLKFNENNMKNEVKEDKKIRR